MNPPPEVLARPFDYSKEQLDIIRSTLAPGLDDHQFAYYIEVCKRLGLDPFAKEIHVQLRKQRGRDGEPDTYKIVIMIGIDGYRRRAADTGELDGQTEPQWCGEDEVWKNVWVAKTPPVAARIGVLRKGCSQPFWGVALFSEYVAMEPDGYDHRTKRVTSWKVSTTWKKMPVGQLMKCFDEETEVLTETGFQRFSQAAGRILQVTDHGLEPVDARPFVQPYSGDMVAFESDDINFCVTPNHDMLTNEGRMEAQALYDSADTRSRFRIPRSVHGSKAALPEMTDDQLVLVAAYLCDGTDISGTSFKVEVSRPRKVAMLRDLALHASTSVREAAGAEATSRLSGRVLRTQFDKVRFVYPYSLIRPIADRGKVFDSRAILSLSRRQARLLVDAMIAFDGHRDAKSKVRRLYSSRPSHVRAFEVASVVAGYSVGPVTTRRSDISVKDGQYLTISERDAISIRRLHRGGRAHTAKYQAPSLKMQPNASGRVWCVTVPSGVIVVRRHGFSMLCGNCAESLGLRKAFPRELGALRTTEEMERSQHDPDDPSPSADTTALPGAGATDGKAPPLRSVADKQLASMDALAARIVEVAKQGAIVVPVPLPKAPEGIPAFSMYGITESIGG